MGNYFGYLRVDSPTTPQENVLPAGRVEEINQEISSSSSSRKRKHETDEIEAEEHENEKDEFTVSERKKMKTTSEYIYETLFINGENSDITIDALGKLWYLHKIYLCQSPYFRSMFKGDWAEKEQSCIHIDIPDEIITPEALKIAFGSLYSYEVDADILNGNLIAVLAASRMFQLDGLLQHCEDSMLSLTCAQNVCAFHQAASRYNLVSVQNKCFNWLEHNLLLCRTAVLAKDLSTSLLKELLLSDNFVVMQVEMDIYNFLKIWLYYRLHPNCELELKKLVVETQKYFESQKSFNGETAFLLTEIGKEYMPVFECLRLENLLGDLKCIKLLEKDNIIPKVYLLPVYEKQWQKMLNVYTCEDMGPTDIPLEVFEKYSCRFGRTLASDTRYCWRWLGFSYGIDIIITYNSRTKTLSVKRNTFSQSCNFAVCLQSQRSVALKFKAFNLDEKGQEKLIKDTGLLTWTFRTDEEIPLITFDDAWEFPIHISARLLLCSANKNPSPS